MRRVCDITRDLLVSIDYNDCDTNTCWDAYCRLRVKRRRDSLEYLIFKNSCNLFNLK